MGTREPVASRRWTLHLLVYPCAVIAATLAVELAGVTGLVILAPSAAVWTWAFIRCLWRDWRLMGPKLGFLALTGLAIMILRPAPPGRVADDLAEVLLRELLEHHSRDRVYFVEVDGEDASPELLRRLADIDVRLKPRSMAVVAGEDLFMEDSTPHTVKDRRTGEYGTLLSVGNVHRERSYILSLVVDIGSFTGDLWAYGKRCRLVRIGRWRITRCTSDWES